MALYFELPIYKHGCELLALAIDVEVQLPRTIKRSLGEGVKNLCMQMLEDMAMANASRGEDRVKQIDQLLVHLRAATALLRVGHEMKVAPARDSRSAAPAISHALWARSVDLLDAVGAQAGGWRQRTLRDLPNPPAA